MTLHHRIEKEADGVYKVIAPNDIQWASLEQDVDGFYKCWFVRKGGYLTEYDFEFLAKSLTELNKEWNEIIMNDPKILGGNSG